MKKSKLHHLERWVKNRFKEKGKDYQSFDLKGNIDWSLSYDENKNQIEEKLKKLGIIESPDRNGIEREEQYISEKFEEDIKRKKEEALERIKSSTTPQIEKYFWHLKKYTKMVAHGYSNVFFCVGKGGIGKSYNILRALGETDREFEYIQGSLSPLQLYHLLYNNKEDILVFDDCYSLIRDKNSFSVLAQALWSVFGDRVVSWHTTSKKLEAPQKFRFEGGIILILNKIPDNEEIRALVSRGLKLKLDFTYDELLKLMYEIAKTPHDRLSKEERFEVVDFIKENTKSSYDINLRVQDKIESFKLYGENWKKLGFKLLEQECHTEVAEALGEFSGTIKRKDLVKEIARRKGIGVRQARNLTRELEDKDVLDRVSRNKVRVLR